MSNTIAQKLDKITPPTCGAAGAAAALRPNSGSPSWCPVPRRAGPGPRRRSTAASGAGRAAGSAAPGDPPNASADPSPDAQETAA